MTDAVGGVYVILEQQTLQRRATIAIDRLIANERSQPGGNGMSGMRISWIQSAPQCLSCLITTGPLSTGHRQEALDTSASPPMSDPGFRLVSVGDDQWAMNGSTTQGNFLGGSVMGGPQAPNSVKSVQPGVNEVSELMLDIGEEQDGQPARAVHSSCAPNVTKLLLGNDRIIRIER